MYYVFNTKARLLGELFMFMAGRTDEPTDTASRDWVDEALNASDGRRTLALACENGADIYRRFAPIYPTVVAAMATEPDIAEAWELLMSSRWKSIHSQMEAVAATGDLKEDLTPAAAADVSFAINSIETYRLLVEERGWEVGDYKLWLYRSLSQLLLRPEVAEKWNDHEILEGTSMASR